LKKFLKDLNKEQYKAATTLYGPVLILAGAGSGKTKTIVSRTTNIIASKIANPNEILVMTFTNKAAREMKERGIKMLMNHGFWSGVEPNFTTFHSWGVKFLKNIDSRVLSQYGLNIKFNIADESDQEAILKKIVLEFFTKKEIELIKIKKIVSIFSQFQNDLIGYFNREECYSEVFKFIDNSGESLFEEAFGCQMNGRYIYKIVDFYIRYKNVLRENNMVDFDDIINIPIYILQNNLNIKNYIRNYYKFIMVDEFQDTNYSQLTLLNLILGEHENICVVGDDSQSIYGWRGAKIDFILNFHKERKKTVRINLKTNYRSTKKIVKKANKLLEHSGQKHEFKEDLVAFKDNKGFVSCSFFKSPEEEVKHVVRSIIKLRHSYGIPYGKIAILYRSNHLNRRFEVELISNNIPYKIHNGKTLLERKAALEILNYLKYLANPDNQLAFSKILISAKVVTEKRLIEFENEAKNLGLDLISYVKEEEFDLKGFGKNSVDKVASFNRELKYFFKELKEKSFHEFIEDFFYKNCISKVHKININKRLNGEKISDNMYDNAMSSMRIINMVEELCLKFDSLEDFLETVALEGEKEDKEESKVNLMTVHASKGLEFGNVFLVGFSQGVFPSSKNLYGKDLEEERRLAYVAITRAEERLFVSGASYYFGNEQPMRISQFAYESGLIKWIIILKINLILIQIFLWVLINHWLILVVVF